MDDDEANMMMLNANLGRREALLPSEKARAYRMEAEILNKARSADKHDLEQRLFKV